MSEEKKQMVTSLRVDSELWKKARIEGIKKGISLAEVVGQALEEWIEKQPLKVVKLSDLNEKE